MRCLSCKYDLKNLTPSDGEYRCPECGRAFDPGDGSTYAHPLRNFGFLRVLTIGAASTFCSALTCLFLMLGAEINLREALISCTFIALTSIPFMGLGIWMFGKTS